MTIREAIEVAVKLMDEVPLKGPDSRTRGMAQAELMKSLQPKPKKVKVPKEKK